MLRTSGFVLPALNLNSNAPSLQDLVCLRNSRGQTQLHLSLARGDLRLATWALERLGSGAWHCKDMLGQTPFDAAGKNEEALEWARAQQRPVASSMEASISQ